MKNDVEQLVALRTKIALPTSEQMTAALRQVLEKISDATNATE
jgi:hypothetical protein